MGARISTGTSQVLSLRRAMHSACACGAIVSDVAARIMDVLCALSRGGFAAVPKEGVSGMDACMRLVSVTALFRRSDRSAAGLNQARRQNLRADVRLCSFLAF